MTPESGRVCLACSEAALYACQDFKYMAKVSVAVLRRKSKESQPDSQTPTGSLPFAVSGVGATFLRSTTGKLIQGYPTSLQTGKP